MSTAQSVWKDLEEVRARSPLVHNITNYVVMNLTANALLSLGASPVMAHAADEVEDMVGIADALVINIGTLSRPWVEAMHRAAAAALRKGIPFVFDPVGAGATKYRTETARAIIERTPPAVIRGNASEVRALILAEGATKGVDSRHGSDAALEAGRELSRRTGAVVSISGALDLIIDAKTVVRVSNGHPLMPRVTGLGCVASALTGAFAAVNPSRLEASAHAMAVMGIAGEIAAGRARGPASFETHFLDELYRLGEKDIRDRLRMERA